MVNGGTSLDKRVDLENIEALEGVHVVTRVVSDIKEGQIELDTIVTIKR